jgi:hypothetical protein
VSKSSGFYPCPAVDTAGSNVVSQAGGVLLTETIRTVRLDKQLSAALAAPERGARPKFAVRHAGFAPCRVRQRGSADPGQVVVDGVGGRSQVGAGLAHQVAGHPCDYALMSAIVRSAAATNAEPDRT